MPTSRTTLGLASCLTLGAAAAAAAAPTPTAKPTPKVECVAPSKDTCVSESYRATACYQQHKAECKDIVEAALKAHYQQKPAPSLKMLRPEQTEMPQHVVPGKYFAYKKLPEMKKAGTVPLATIYRKANDPLAGIAGMDMSSTPPVDRVTKVDPAEAAKYHRNPAWRDNGPAVRSCKEYAYARSYNGARFIDAASACKGDRECVFAVAYMDAPVGIARHRLDDEDGLQMTRQLDSPKVSIPKNDFFVAAKFVKARSATLPNGMKIEDTERVALQNALSAGSNYYTIGYCSGGACDGTRKFAGQWDWHKRLHDRTASLSQAEAEEYERRRARMRALLEQWGTAVSREKSMGKGITLEQQIVLPFDMRAYDPFERYDREREIVEHGLDVQRTFKQKFGEAVVNLPRTQAIQQIQQKLNMQGALPDPAGASMAAALLAAPAPKPAPKPKPVPQAKGKAGHAGPTTTPLANVDPAAWTADATISKCLGTDGWGLEMMFQGPISCRIEELLISEWRRKAAGQKSCLDLGNDGCDWSPQMFEDGVLSQVQKLDIAVSDEAYCNAYLEANTFKDEPQTATVTRVKARLDETKQRIEQELKAVSMYLRGHDERGQRLGKDWDGGDYVGDKDWFAAGYDYGVGWDVMPAQKTNNGLVCKLEGSAHGEMGFDAWIVGSKIPVVDGSVWAEAKINNGGEGRFNAHLEMMGQSVFNTDGWDVAHTFEPADDMGYAIKVPPGLKPRFDIYVGVPISGQMWGELLFGSTLELGAASPEGCDPANPRFAVGAQYTPVFGAFGLGQVGVGIAGIASAGIRASLTLIMLGLPASVDMQAVVKNGTPKVSFGSGLDLMLVTLAGRVSLYVEFLMFDEEFELFRWKGFKTAVPLMPRLTADVSFTGLK